MAEINIIGVGQRPNYIKADRVQQRISFQSINLMASVALCSYDYMQQLSDLLNDSGGVTLSLFKLLYCIVVVYPWVTVCLFIGQYSKKCFLVVRHMAPLCTGPLLVCFVLSAFFCGKLDEFPSVTKSLNGIIYWNATTFQECSLAIKKNIKEELARCERFNPINYTSLCYFRKEKLIFPEERYYHDVIHQLSGTTASFLALCRGIIKFSRIFYFVLLIYFGSNLFTLLFAFIRLRPTEITDNFLYQDSSSNFLNCMGTFVRCFGWEVHSLTMNSPILIMLGTQLPINKTPAVSALLVAFYQYLLSIFYAFAYVADLSVIAKTYKVPIACVVTPDYFESKICGHFSATNILYEDQGLRATQAMHIFNFLLYRALQIMCICVHVLGLYYSIIDELPLSIAKYKKIRLLIMFVLCVILNFFSHISLVEKFISHVYIKPFVVKVGLFHSLSLTLAIFFIYGTFELNKDMMFLYSKGILPGLKISMIALPFIVGVYFLWRIYFFMIAKPLSLTNSQGIVTDFDLLPYYMMVLIPIGILTTWMIVTIVIEWSRGNISEAFLPTEQWAPWSPPGENYGQERQHFHPELAVKFEGDYYRCAHNCWLENDVIKDEIDESKRTSDSVTEEIKEVDIRTLLPNLYKEYKHVFRYFESIKK